MSFFFRRSTYQIIFWLWCALILGLALIPSVNTPKISIEKMDVDIRMDYFVHFFLYFILVLLFAIWKYRDLVDSGRNKLLLYVFSGLIYAVITESIHVFLPRRGFNPIDMSLNILGLTVGLICFFYIVKKYRNHKFISKLLQID